MTEQWLRPSKLREYYVDNAFDSVEGVQQAALPCGHPR
jgi:hypothetical protein